MSAKEQLLKELKELASVADERKRELALEKSLQEKLEKMVQEHLENESSPRYVMDPGTSIDWDRIPDGIRKMVWSPAEVHPDPELAHEVQRWNDQVVIASALMKRHPTQLAVWQSFAKGETALAKALDGATSGSGAEFVPTILSNQFITRMEGEYRIASTFSRKITIPSGVGSVDVPAAGSAASVYRLTGSTSDTFTPITSTSPGTRKVTLDPVRFGVMVQLEDEFTEDSAVAVADFIRDELAVAMARAIDDCIVNGDTAGTHQDSDVTASNDHRKMWNGLRKLTLSTAKVDTSDTVSVANLRATWNKMRNGNNIYGLPEDLVIATSMPGYLKLLTMAEVLTTDKASTKATVLSGELKQVLGAAVIMSSVVRSDLNASGVYDGTTTNRTITQLYNRRAFVIGDKRAVTVETDRDIRYARDYFVVSARMDFEAAYDTTTEPITAQMYNITSDN